MSRSMGGTMRAIVILFWASVVAAPFVSHFAIVSGRFTAVAAGFSAVQAVAVGIVGWRARGSMRAISLVLAAFMLVLALLRLLYSSSAAVELITTSGVTHAILYSSLLLLFGQTLQIDRRPLVTVMATRMQGPLTPALSRYTRAVTVAWCCFFAGQLVLSAALFIWAPHAAWSLVVNVLDGPMVLVMFAAEYTVRRLRFRSETHVSPFAIIRSFARDRAVIENG